MAEVAGSNPASPTIEFVPAFLVHAAFGAVRCSKSSCTIKVHARRLRSGASCPCGQTAPSLSPALRFLRYGRHRNRRTQETLERIRSSDYFSEFSGFCTELALDLIRGSSPKSAPSAALEQPQALSRGWGRRNRRTQKALGRIRGLGGRRKTETVVGGCRNFLAP